MNARRVFGTIIDAMLLRDELHVWHINLDVNPASLQQASALLDDQERTRAAKFVTPLLRDRYIVAHACMRQLLAEYADRPPGAIQYEKNRHGKPTLVDPAIASRLSFSLTHSENMALLAISAGHPIGIDIEKVNPYSDLEAVAHRNFTALERAALSTLDKSDILSGFYAMWTRKESFIKAIGNGLSYPLQSFEVPVQLHPRNTWTLIQCDDTELACWYVQDISRLPDYAAAVVCSNPVIKVSELVLPA